MKELEKINIPSIVLKWSEWISWNDLRVDARGKSLVEVIAPNKEKGVYEVKLKNTDERLTIGKASDLRMRIKQGLVRGRVPHSAGRRIRANEDVSNVVVRWAITNRPAAAEEELHRHYQTRFSELPKYTKHT